MKVRVTWADIVARQAAQEGGADGLIGAAQMILEASNQLVPYESGTLMGSGAVDFDLDAQTAHVFYDTVYAARLHQNPKFAFGRGRRGKFLAAAARQGREHAATAIGEGLRLRFRGRRRPRA